MKRIRILGWGLFLLGIISIVYAIYQQRVMGENIKPLHIIGILSMFIGWVNFVWLSKRT
jgi:uncharacterized membrane protein HdeD (DUF308 family)